MSLVADHEQCRRLVIGVVVGLSVLLLMLGVCCVVDEWKIGVVVDCVVRGTLSEMLFAVVGVVVVDDGTRVIEV
jgi:hypothetical protein